MKLSHFFTLVLYAAVPVTAWAQTAPINTVPEGITTFNLLATTSGTTTTSYFSAPLANDPVYTGAVSTVITSNGGQGPDTVSVGDSPPPWSTGQLNSPSVPYFLKFLTGNEAGRVLQVLSNTTNSVTLDVYDNTAQATFLNTSTPTDFSVQPGDTFEIFAGDTLGLMFGLNTVPSPLVLKGTTDSVGIYSPPQNKLIAYTFNTTLGFWVQVGSTANANNTIIRPYSGFYIIRGGGEMATSFVLTGRVAEVNHRVKTTGGNTAAYDSTGYPVDVMLSQLQLGTNWVKATIPASPAVPTSLYADTVSVWNTGTKQFDTYFELTDNTWRKVLGGATDQSSFVIPAATTVCFVKRQSVSGADSYLEPVLPYSLTN